MTRTEAAAQAVESALRGEPLMHWPAGILQTYPAPTACGAKVPANQVPYRAGLVTCPLCRLAAGLAAPA